MTCHGTGRDQGTKGRSSPVPPAAVAAVVVLLLGLGSACASPIVKPRSPEDTIRTFSQALNRGDRGLAYAMMSKGYRERVSQAQFEQLLKDNAEETAAMVEALSRPRQDAVEVAVIDYDEGSEIRLERQGGHWLIASDIINFYDQSTPRAALKSFVRAMERRRYDVVTRLVPTPDKDGITIERMQEAWSGEAREEVERMLSNLRNHLDAPIEVVGDHATMPYGDHMRVQFVSEAGVWKIEDPE